MTDSLYVEFVLFLVFGMAGLTSRKSITNIFRCGILWAVILVFLWSCSEGEPPAVTGGDAGKNLRLVIKWPGDEMASKQDLALMAKIQQRLVENNLGKFVRSGTGRGWMDIVLEVQDKDRARTEIEAIVKAIAPDAKFAIQ